MNSDEPIEAALRRQPSDEREFDEPLAALVNGAGVQRVRPVTRPRLRTNGLRALAGLGAVLVLIGALVRVGLPLGSGVFGGGQTPVQPTGLIGCWGQGIGFSPQVLTSAQADAETADTGPAAALRADLGQEPDMPASGWVIVSESDSLVMFIAREPTIADARYAEVTVQRGTSLSGAVGADGWQVAGSGGCQLMAVPPSGYATGTWSLDPSVAYSATATELSIDVSELACSSGTSPEGRIVTSVDYGQTSVAVTVFVRSLSGAQTCQLTISATPEPPYVVHLDQPVESRDLVDGGTWPPPTIATGGHVVVVPTPTPEPSNWHMPMDCTGEADGPGSFKAASMSAAFDVYCAALPAGWKREAMSGDGNVVTTLTVSYRGPKGGTLALSEGDLCGGGQSACAPAGTSVGTAMFGGREGQLFTAPPGADFALYVDPGKSPSWMATGTGMSLDAFKALTAVLIIVGK
jgi:hypothetical protein